MHRVCSTAVKVDFGFLVYSHVYIYEPRDLFHPGSTVFVPIPSRHDRAVRQSTKRGERITLPGTDVTINSADYVGASVKGRKARGALTIPPS